MLKLLVAVIGSCVIDYLLQRAAVKMLLLFKSS